MHGGLPIGAAPHDGRQHAEALRLQTVGDIGHAGLGGRHHGVAHGRVSFKREKDLHQYRVLAEGPELLGPSPQPAPSSGRRNEDGHFVRAGTSISIIHANPGPRATGSGHFRLPDGYLMKIASPNAKSRYSSSKASS